MEYKQHVVCILIDIAQALYEMHKMRYRPNQLSCLGQDKNLPEDRWHSLQKLQSIWMYSARVPPAWPNIKNEICINNYCIIMLLRERRPHASIYFPVKLAKWHQSSHGNEGSKDLQSQVVEIIIMAVGHSRPDLN